MLATICIFLSARKKNLTTARARKNNDTACMRASARKDHSIPLELFEWDTYEALYE